MKIRVSEIREEIVVEAVEKVQSALDRAQQGARSRRVDIEDLAELLQELACWLDSIIEKKHQKGIKAILDFHAQNFSSSYQYSPESTIIEVEKFSSGWFMTDCVRGACRTPTNRIVLKLTDEHKSAIANFVTQYKNQ